MEWFVVHTQPRKEMTARQHLINQNFQVYLPCIRKPRSHARRRDWSILPLFPRYLFVQIDTETSRWRAINSTVGVSHLISQNDRPTPIANKIVDDIRDAEDEKGYIGLNQIQPLTAGEEVEFLAGPLAHQSGTLFDADDDERVTVLLKMMGRDVKVVAQLDEIMRTG